MERTACGHSMRKAGMYQWLKRLLGGGQAQGAPAEAPEAAVPAAATAPAAVLATAAPQAATSAPSPAASADTPPPGPGYVQLETVNAAFARLLFGSVQQESAAMAAETRVLDAMNAIARSQNSGADLMRRMPGVVPQLLQSLRSETFSGAEVARKISNDMVLVAAVIRLANSSALAPGQPVSSVQNAVMVIGQEGLRQLVTSVAFKPIIDLNSGPHTRRLAPRIWDHSERCAVACRKLAPTLDVEPLDAFLAGLVQNAGMLVSLNMMDRSATDGQRLGSVAFTARLQIAARVVAAGIAREWRFPDAVVQALNEQVTVRRGVVLSAMGRLLGQVDYLCKIKLLAESGQPEAKDDTLFEGLPEYAAECYAGLVKIDDT